MLLKPMLSSKNNAMVSNCWLFRLNEENDPFMLIKDGIKSPWLLYQLFIRFMNIPVDEGGPLEFKT